MLTRGVLGLPGFFTQSQFAYLAIIVVAAGCAESPEVSCGCDPTEHCVAGRCVPVVDGGADSGMDGGSDAGVDADVGTDGATSDSGPPDAGTPDTGTPDTGVRDAGMPDAGPCGAAGCGLWVLPAGAVAWRRFPIDPTSSTFAPTRPIRAAFDVEEAGEAFVLTDTTYHVLRLTDRAWIRSGSRNSIMPEAAGQRLLFGWSIPSAHLERFGGAEGVEVLNVHSALRTYEWNYEIATNTFSLSTQRDCCGDAWLDGSYAPSHDQVRATWLDVTNSESWATWASPTVRCPAAGGRAIEPYLAAVTGTSVHTYEAGWCFGFVNRQALGSFRPFALPGAPAIDDIGAAFWYSGLWVLAES